MQLNTIQDNPVIKVENVFKSFKQVKAVRGVNLEIPKGQFVAILGPNGAGKTTLVEMIEGIQLPDKGDIFVLGKKWKGNEDELHHYIGLSLQETRYMDKLKVWETLELFSSFYDLNKSRVDEIIQLVGLEDKRKARVVNLSGGQRQKLALGIALLNNPKILLLDEPTTGLDPNARREVWSILLKLKERSETSLILTTHYMEEAEQLCDYIIIIDSGTILKEGTKNELLEASHGEKIIEFNLDETVENSEIFNSSFKIEWNEDYHSGKAIIKNLEKELPELIYLFNKNNYHLKNLVSRRKTLDDLFTSLTGRHLHE